MNNVAMLHPDGRVAFVVHPSYDEQYEDGELYGDYVAKIVPFEMDTLALLNMRWDADEQRMVELPPRLGEFYDWDPTTLVWIRNDARKAEWLTQTINPIRDRLEGGRVVVDGHLIDIDERAEKRMTDALEMWDALGVTTLPWTLGDNTILHVDKAQLQRFFDEGRRLRALRSLQLHTEARALKDNLDTTQEDIDAWEASYA